VEVKLIRALSVSFDLIQEDLLEIDIGERTVFGLLRRVLLSISWLIIRLLVPGSTELALNIFKGLSTIPLDLKYRFWLTPQDLLKGSILCCCKAVPLFSKLQNILAFAALPTLIGESLKVNDP
jgi:hypothetical protein